MDGSNERKCKRTIYLPQEMIENILPRLPVKSLLRFKSVCKRWRDTISDPEFPQTHLRLSNNTTHPPDLYSSRSPKLPNS
ncbi:hypothetical protein OROGR_002371 [Orobanche gracilis]